VFGLAANEAEHECPDKGRDLVLVVAFDHTESLGVLFEELGGKRCSESIHNLRCGAITIYRLGFLISFRRCLDEPLSHGFSFD
jgi:hypothetical protein